MSRIMKYNFANFNSHERGRKLLWTGACLEPVVYVFCRKCSVRGAKALNTYACKAMLPADFIFQLRDGLENTRANFPPRIFK